jgi:hypothetical protein
LGFYSSSEGLDCGNGISPVSINPDNCCSDTCYACPPTPSCCGDITGSQEIITITQNYDGNPYTEANFHLTVNYYEVATINYKIIDGYCQQTITYGGSIHGYQYESTAPGSSNTITTSCTRDANTGEWDCISEQTNVNGGITTVTNPDFDITGAPAPFVTTDEWSGDILCTCPDMWVFDGTNCTYSG